MSLKFTQKIQKNLCSHNGDSNYNNAMCKRTSQTETFNHSPFYISGSRHTVLFFKNKQVNPSILLDHSHGIVVGEVEWKAISIERRPKMGKVHSQHIQPNTY